jgi:hypothetical protein
VSDRPATNQVKAVKAWREEKLEPDEREEGKGQDKGSATLTLAADGGSKEEEIVHS